jgi:tRNA isopentenyl-2-thiomethyl-A-37 hydroxylase MiaE
MDCGLACYYLGSMTVLSSEAKQYQAFARDCLQMAEKANDEDVRRRLIELARDWMEAALMEERRRSPLPYGPIERAA